MTIKNTLIAFVLAGVLSGCSARSGHTRNVGYDMMLYDSDCDVNIFSSFLGVFTYFLQFSERNCGKIATFVILYHTILCYMIIITL